MKNEPSRRNAFMSHLSLFLSKSFSTGPTRAGYRGHLISKTFNSPKIAQKFYVFKILNWIFMSYI